MAWYHKWDVKNNFANVLQFFSLISDGLGGVSSKWAATILHFKKIRQIAYLFAPFESGGVVVATGSVVLKIVKNFILIPEDVVINVELE